MSVELTIILSVISAIGVVTSIIFAFLAFNRDRRNDVRNEIREDYNGTTNLMTDIAMIKVDIKYTRDGISRINNRLDDLDKNQTKMTERLSKMEEHIKRTDARLTKLEQATFGQIINREEN